MGPAGSVNVDDVEMFERNQLGMQQMVDPWKYIGRGMSREHIDNDELAPPEYRYENSRVAALLGRTHAARAASLVGRAAGAAVAAHDAFRLRRSRGKNSKHFCFREARLADENRYDEWFALWTEDVRYWVPVNIDDYDPDEHVSIIYDDRERLELRIAAAQVGRRLGAGAAVADAAADLEHRDRARPGRRTNTWSISNFVLGELRRGREGTYFAPAKAHPAHDRRTVCGWRPRRSCS